MTNYRSLVPGGFFSADPYNHAVPTAIRTNNPGAINASHDWIVQFPGYVGRDETTPGNLTAIFEAPEYGVALWWKLFSIYQKSLSPTFTLHNIIYTYCGVGREQEAADYLSFVCRQTGLSETFVVDLGADASLLKIARAFYRYEAGKPSPLGDNQILYGFNFARQMMPATNMALDQLPVAHGFGATLKGITSRKAQPKAKIKAKSKALAKRKSKSKPKIKSKTRSKLRSKRRGKR